MIRYPLFSLLLTLTITAQAEQSEHAHGSNANRGVGSATDEETQSRLPRQVGQSAFAAIQEIVSILDADPTTDWSSVDIEALRQHLIDMHNVTLYSNSAELRLEDGMEYTITGTETVRGSIQRMVQAHAATMDGHGGWRFDAQDHPQGAVLTVSVSKPADLAKLHGLGFVGVMAYGIHHQGHHMMIATGSAHHHH